MFRALNYSMFCVFLFLFMFSSLPVFSFFTPYQAGESVQSVMEKLKTDPLVFYQDRQVLMTIPVVKDSQIFYEVDKRVRALAAAGQGGYIRQMYFYFKGERLSSLSLIFSPKFTSYYEIFLKLTQKYGQPSQVKGPDLVEWNKGSTLVRLTRPINVKYMDKLLLEESKKEYRETQESKLSVKENILDRL